MPDSKLNPCGPQSLKLDHLLSEPCSSPTAPIAEVRNARQGLISLVAYTHFRCHSTWYGGSWGLKEQIEEATLSPVWCRDKPVCSQRWETLEA